MITVTARLLVVVTGLVSTTASLVGGLVLYIEGLSLVEDTVSELSHADVNSVASELTTTLNLSISVAHMLKDTMMHWDGVQTEAEYKNWIRHASIATIFSFPRLYSSGIIIAPMHNTTNNGTGYHDVAWIDTLADGSKDYIFGEYSPKQWKNANCATDRCANASSVSRETREMTFAYYWEDHVINAFQTTFLPKQVGWESGNVTFWRVPSVWYAKDGTPQIFLSYHALLPPLDIPFLHEMKVFASGYVLVPMWQDMMLAYQTEASMALSPLDEGGKSVVMATNMGLHLGTSERCLLDNPLNGRKECILTLANSPPALRDAGLVLVETPEWDFVRKQAGGEEYWLRRASVYKPGPLDDMTAIYLLWLRPVASVNDELNRGLFFFIIFVVLVFVFDVFIGVAEVLLVATPLNRLASAIEPLEAMDLDAARARLACFDKSCITVKEVGRVVAGIRYAVAGLEEFKAFLPGSLFDGSLDDGQPNGPTLRAAAIAAVDMKSKGGSQHPPEEAVQCVEQCLEECNGRVHPYPENLNLTIATFKGTVEAVAFCVAAQRKLEALVDCRIAVTCKVGGGTTEELLAEVITLLDDTPPATIGTSRTLLNSKSGEDILSFVKVAHRSTRGVCVAALIPKDTAGRTAADLPVGKTCVVLIEPYHMRSISKVIAGEVRNLYNSIVTSSVANAKGVVHCARQGQGGDSFVVSFSSAEQAISFALDAFTALHKEKWPRDVAKALPRDAKLWNGPPVRMAAAVGTCNGTEECFEDLVSRAASIVANVDDGYLAVTNDVVADAGGGEQVELYSHIAPVGLIAGKGVLGIFPLPLSARAQDIATQGHRRPSSAARRGCEDPVKRAVATLLLDWGSLASHPIESFFSSLTSILTSTKGKILQIQGGSVTLYWDTSGRAWECGGLIFKHIPYGRRQKTHLGLAYGTTLKGNLSLGSKRFATILGQPVEDSSMLARASQRLHVYATTNALPTEERCTRFARTVELPDPHPLGKTPMRIFQIHLVAYVTPSDFPIGTVQWKADMWGCASFEAAMTSGHPDLIVKELEKATDPVMVALRVRVENLVKRPTCSQPAQQRILRPVKVEEDVAQCSSTETASIYSATSEMSQSQLASSFTGPDRTQGFIGLTVVAMRLDNPPKAHPSLSDFVSKLVNDSLPPEAELHFTDGTIFVHNRSPETALHFCQKVYCAMKNRQMPKGLEGMSYLPVSMAIHTVQCEGGMHPASDSILPAIYKTAMESLAAVKGGIVLTEATRNWLPPKEKHDLTELHGAVVHGKRCMLYGVDSERGLPVLRRMKSDDPDDLENPSPDIVTERFKILVLYAVGMGVLYLGNAVVTAAGSQWLAFMGYLAAVGIVASFLVVTLLLKSLSVLYAEVLLISLSLVCVYADITSSGGMELWVNIVVHLMLLHLSDCSERSKKLVGYIGALGLVARLVEDSFSIGMYPEPSTELQMRDAVLSGAHRMISFAALYALVGHMQHRLVSEGQQLEVTISAAKDVVHAATVMDFTEARAKLSSSAVPIDIQVSLSTVMRQLEAAVPYLPAYPLAKAQEQGDSVSEISFSTRRSTTSVKEAGFVSWAVQVRRVGLLLVNVRGTLETMASLGVYRMQSYYDVVVASVLHTATEHKGVLEALSGDRMLVSFNASLRTAGPHTSSCMCAWVIKTTVAKSASDMLNAISMAFPPLHFNMAVTLGDVCCGEMGCSRMRRYNFLGGSVALVYRLLDFGRGKGLDILCDQQLCEANRGTFWFRLVHTLRLHKGGLGEVKVWELCDVVQNGDKEWMYTLEEEDPWRDFNHAAELALRGELDAAKAQLPLLGPKSAVLLRELLRDIPG